MQPGRHISDPLKTVADHGVAGLTLGSQMGVRRADQKEPDVREAPLRFCALPRAATLTRDVNA